MEYPKIETLFERDPSTFRVIPAQFRRPIFSSISRWHATEKVDGTNIRVMLSQSGHVTFGGKTDAASIPSFLLRKLEQMFPPLTMQQGLWLKGPCEAVLYGEGYGSKMAKGGGLYRPDQSFRLFDVLIGGKWWLDWEDVCDVANKLSIKTVPYLGLMSTEQAIQHVSSGEQASLTAWEDSSTLRQAEGIVARPIECLFDKQGERIMFKLKARDYGMEGLPLKQV